MAVDAGGAPNVAKRTGNKIVEVAVKYLIPVALFFAGVFTWDVWGGENAMWNLMSKANADKSSGGTNLAALASAGVFGGIFAAVGYVFWEFGRGDGMIERAIGRGVGAYFFGVALGYVFFAFAPTNGIPDGVLDDLINGASNLAGG